MIKYCQHCMDFQYRYYKAGENSENGNRSKRNGIRWDLIQIFKLL